MPVPLVDLRIVDAEMNDVPHDGEHAGEIVVRAPWLTHGYLNNPRLRRSSGRAAICTPATSATSTARRRLQITDRIKDVIKTGGEWISSLEIEDILLQHARR